MAIVSVIIPVYNVEKYLKRCLKSVQYQTLRDIEIIIVDDGSTDNCPIICDSFAKEDSRAIVIHKRNGGLSSARNVGLVNAAGKYVFFVDSDDWLELNGLETLVEMAEKYRVDFVRYRVIRSGWPGLPEDAPCMLGKEREIPGGYYDRERMKEILYSRLLITRELTMGPILSAWGALYNTDFLKKNHLYFEENIRFSEDMIFSAKVVLAAKNFYYQDSACVYHYFYNPNSISKSFRKGRWESCKKIILYSQKEFSGHIEYDFTAQLERIKWFCALLALGERKYLPDYSQRQKYCKMILQDEILDDLKLHGCGIRVSRKQYILLLLVKFRAADILARL